VHAIGFKQSEAEMDVLIDLLFKTDFGLLSLFTILFIIGMSVFFSIWFKKKMNEPDGEQDSPPQLSEHQKGKGRL
jgi:hypothetical protein